MGYTPPIPRTVIEFVDVPERMDKVMHKTAEIRINGTPVLVARDGVDFDFGSFDNGKVTTVTLRLQPTEIRFIRDPE